MVLVESPDGLRPCGVCCLWLGLVSCLIVGFHCEILESGVFGLGRLALPALSYPLIRFPMTK